jgi:hypothetical protein
MSDFIIEKYNSSNKVINITPYNLFMLVEYQNIQTDNSFRSKRLALRDKWMYLDFKTKSQYEKAAVTLGYKQNIVTNFKANLQMRNNLRKKIELMKENM